MIFIHQCISGFTQTADRPHGLLKLSEQLHALGFNNRVSRVSLLPWNADWSQVAEHYWLLSQHHNLPVIVNMYAYSWGVGWGAVRLAEELRRRDVHVETIVAADGVFRHPNPLLRWHSLLRSDLTLSPVIHIPANVTRVIPFHQTLNRPQGHRIVGGEGFSGEIRPSRELHATHQYCDDAHEFHEAAIAAAHRLTEVVL